MDDPLLVGGFQRLGDLPGDGEGFVEWDRTSGDPILKRRPFDIFEDECRRTTAFLQAMNGGDVGVVERRQHLRFPLEPGQPLGVMHEGVGQDLQGDITVELRVPRFVDLPHAARTDGGEDLVDAERAADFQGHDGK